MKILPYFKSKTCDSDSPHLASLAGLASDSRRIVSNKIRLFENCITKQELAQHFKVSVSFINKLMSEESLPHIKIGRSVRFRLDDVYAWFERKGTKL